MAMEWAQTSQLLMGWQKSHGLGKRATTKQNREWRNRPNREELCVGADQERYGEPAATAVSNTTDAATDEGHHADAATAATSNGNDDASPTAGVTTIAYMEWKQPI